MGIKNLSGAANAKGFKICDRENKIWARVTNGIISFGKINFWLTLNFWQDLSPGSLTVIIAFLVSCFIALLFFGSAILFQAVIFFSVLTAVNLLIIFYPPACRKIALLLDNNPNPDISQWHACEHKLINVLEKDKEITEITLESLENASALHLRCGTGKIQSRFLLQPTRKQLEITISVGQEYLKKLKEKGG